MSQVVNFNDPLYPEVLKNIPNPPKQLYYQGDLSILNRRVVAIVGTRNPTAYGLMVTEKLARDLANSGVVLVSGLARGIDTAVHKTVVESDGLTVAVLGSGLDQITPASNTHLVEKILKKGLIISEYPPGTPSLPHHFPARNRIISGLSEAVIITEAAKRSGSLITARCASEQGRDVYAVPGPINSLYSQGCHYLIRQGAGLIESVDQLLEELGIDSGPSAKSNLSLNQQSLLSYFQGEAVHINQLCEITQQDISLLNVQLLELELKGSIKNIGGGYYLKAIQ